MHIRVSNEVNSGLEYQYFASGISGEARGSEANV
jgi:hypothetical protein